MADKEFIDGLIVKAPGDKAPDFIKCKISIERKKLGNWLRGKDDEWINIDVKVSKGGAWYSEVNNWKPDQAAEKPAAKKDDFSDPTPFLHERQQISGVGVSRLRHEIH